MYILLCLLPFLTWNPGHEYHAIYLSTITLEVKKDGVHGVIKVFEDDFRDGLRGFNGDIPVDTSSLEFISVADEYFDQMIVIEVSGTPLEFNVTNIERVGDSYQVGYSSNQKGAEGILTFKVKYFFELFPTQQNILHFKYGDKQWYHIFKKGKETLSLDINS